MKLELVIAILVILCVSSFVIAIINIDKWLFVLLDPGPFDPSFSPPKPDYMDSASWAALPSLKADAGVFLPELPAIDQTTAAADLFYVHTTTWVGKQWNGPIDDPKVIEATARGAILIQASAFNACCAIYAPRYRQANGKAYTASSPDGDHAIDLAYADVAEAFDVFVDQYNMGRPFILASHSQGTVLAARLFREKIWGKEPYDRLVAAYLIGGPISPETIGKDVPICSSETQTGCVIAWNARGPRYVGNDLEFENLEDPDATDKMAGRICVNPLTWKSDGTYAPKTMHKGALFLDSEAPKVLLAFSDAKCFQGKLLVNQIGTPPRDFMSKVLDWMLGPENYHAFEYQLFYVNIRQNAAKRVDAFLKNRQANRLD